MTTTTLRPLEHVDEIRDLLYGRGRGRPRAARCELYSVRARVDDVPAIVYSTYPLDPWSVPDAVRRARVEHELRRVAGHHATGLARLAEASRRRARTEANLEWLRGWGLAEHLAQRESALVRRNFGREL